MDEVVIRRATNADWPEIARLLAELALPLDGATDHLSGYRVAIDRDDLVGVVGIEVHGDVGLLRSLAVRDTSRGSGLGARLVDTATRDARERGVRTLFLLTTTAARYFERRGFVPLARYAAPHELQASAEFCGACPASATLMRRAIE